MIKGWKRGTCCCYSRTVRGKVCVGDEWNCLGLRCLGIWMRWKIIQKSWRRISELANACYFNVTTFWDIVNILYYFTIYIVRDIFRICCLKLYCLKLIDANCIMCSNVFKFTDIELYSILQQIKVSFIVTNELSFVSNCVLVSYRERIKKYPRKQVLNFHCNFRPRWNFHDAVTLVTLFIKYYREHWMFRAFLHIACLFYILDISSLQKFTSTWITFPDERIKKYPRKQVLNFHYNFHDEIFTMPG